MRFAINGPLRPVVACHCSQCRRWTGHFLASTAARRADLEIMEGRGLRWYRSSPRARRAFCVTCGSSLLWEGDGDGYVAIAAGALDGPTGLALIGHIFVADKGDYYALDDGLPQRPQGGAGALIAGR
ncbi:MAG: GFA family protein [Alphaproteobacteria bacterium]